MNMDAHICGRCDHPWAAHSGYSDTNLCRIPGCVCERSSLNAEKHNNEDARDALQANAARIATLEAENKALREAVDVLAEEIREHFAESLWHKSPVRVARTPLFDAIVKRHHNPIAEAAVSKIISLNPLASAAVKGEQK